MKSAPINPTTMIGFLITDIISPNLVNLEPRQVNYRFQTCNYSYLQKYYSDRIGKEDRTDRIDK